MAGGQAGDIMPNMDIAGMFDQNSYVPLLTPQERARASRRLRERLIALLADTGGTESKSVWKSA
jgi:hypothetical protein